MMRRQPIQDSMGKQHLIIYRAHNPSKTPVWQPPQPQPSTKYNLLNTAPTSNHRRLICSSESKHAYISSDRHFQLKRANGVDHRRSGPIGSPGWICLHRKTIFTKLFIILSQRWTRIKWFWKVKAIAHARAARPVALNHWINEYMELSSIAYKTLKQETYRRDLWRYRFGNCRTQNSFKLNNFDVRVLLRFTTPQFTDDVPRSANCDFSSTVLALLCQCR